MGHHILVPKEGVAVHINAYNFPVWGMLEKCAVNWLAGVPAVVKPASITSYLTEAVVKEIIASGIFPKALCNYLRQCRRSAGSCNCTGCSHIYRFRVNRVNAEIAQKYSGRKCSF